MPIPAGPITGSPGAGSTPCGWTITTGCCDGWAEYSEAVRTAATNYATLVLWAATGRRYGLCEVAVRPCGTGGDCGEISWGGDYLPYFVDGGWYTCGCSGGCSCSPSQQVRLPGPVDSIVEVQVDGVVVDPTTYRVDDRLWLVRTGADNIWPSCADLDATSGTGFFQVTYERGEAVPAALSDAAGALACEYAKACTGAACRLPGRAVQVVRQGVSIQMVDVDSLLERGLTGLIEVDAVIRALNPRALTHRPRVYSPDLEPSRMVTS